jgi:hypothetical protein
LKKLWLPMPNPLKVRTLPPTLKAANPKFGPGRHIRQCSARSVRDEPPVDVERGGASGAGGVELLVVAVDGTL